MYHDVNRHQLQFHLSIKIYLPHFCGGSTHIYQDPRKSYRSVGPRIGLCCSVTLWPDEPCPPCGESVLYIIYASFSNIATKPEIDQSVLKRLEESLGAPGMAFITLYTDRHSSNRLRVVILPVSNIRHVREINHNPKVKRPSLDQYQNPSSEMRYHTSVTANFASDPQMMS